MKNFRLVFKKDDGNNLEFNQNDYKFVKYLGTENDIYNQKMFEKRIQWYADYTPPYIQYGIPTTRYVGGGGGQVTIGTTSNNTDFGDLTVARRGLAAAGSSTMGAGGFGGVDNRVQLEVEERQRREYSIRSEMERREIQRQEDLARVEEERNRPRRPWERVRNLFR